MEFKHNFGEISMGKTLRCLADSTSPLLQRLCVICALAALFASHCFMCKIPDNMENLTTSITNNLPTDYEIHSWNKTKMCNKEDVQNFLEKAQEIIEIFDGKMKNESFIKQDISKVQRSVKDFSTCISMETLAQNFCLRFQPNLPQNFFGDLHSIMLNISLNIPSPQNKCLCFLESLTSPKPTNDMTGKSTTLPNTEEVHTQEATVTDQTTSYQPPLKNPLKHHETDGWKRMAIISMSLCIILLFILVALLLYYRQLTQREGYTGPRRNEIA